MTRALPFALVTLSLLAGAGPVRARARVEVTAAACHHVPGANYVEPPGVEFEPGIDATGHAVAPAEAGRSPVRLPDRFVIPVTDQLYARLAGTASGTTAAAGVVYPQAVLGVIVFDHGRLTFNGQPLDADGEAAASQVCEQAGSGP